MSMQTQVFDNTSLAQSSLSKFPKQGKIVVTYISTQDDQRIQDNPLLDPVENPIVYVADSRDQAKSYLDQLKQ